MLSWFLILIWLLHAFFHSFLHGVASCSVRSLNSIVISTSPSPFVDYFLHYAPNITHHCSPTHSPPLTHQYHVTWILPLIGPPLKPRLGQLSGLTVSQSPESHDRDYRRHPPCAGEVRRVLIASEESAHERSLALSLHALFVEAPILRDFLTAQPCEIPR